MTRRVCSVIGSHQSLCDTQSLALSLCAYGMVCGLPFVGHGFSPAGRCHLVLYGHTYSLRGSHLIQSSCVSFHLGTLSMILAIVHQCEPLD